jgi:predicted dithiol-disulfide oxidoreductase (DUF899 family)
MTNPNINVVSREEWLEARTRLLAKEKEFNQLRDSLSEERRTLPWVRVDEPYVFERSRGKATLAELFDGRNQLVVYHFMFAPEWEAGCKSCTFWADNFERNVIHLAHRNVTLIAVSRAPLEKLTKYAKRLDWSFEWVSSNGNAFNYDFGVSFTPEQIATGEVTYNFRKQKPYGTDLPGISVFVKDDAGAVFHTYSTYSRGIDMMNAAYHYLDLVPKGRDESDGAIMSWLRRRDEYGA